MRLFRWLRSLRTPHEDPNAAASLELDRRSKEAVERAQQTRSRIDRLAAEQDDLDRVIRGRP